MPSGRRPAEWLGAPERPLEPHWKVMGEEAGQRLISCVGLPAAIGACTLADRRNNVHCLRYGPHISAINSRVRFVIHPRLTHHHTDTRTIFLQESSVLPSQAQLRSPREHQHFFRRKSCTLSTTKKRFPRSQTENLQPKDFWAPQFL